MSKRILCWALTFIMLFSMTGGSSLDALGLTIEPECRIGETDYTFLADALAASVDGDTITLLTNISHTGKITITNKKITFDLNGYILDASNTGDTTVEVGAGGEIDLTGEGEFNVVGSDLANVGYNDNRGTISINGGGKITVTNVISTGSSSYPSYGIYVSDGSANVLNNVDVLGEKRVGIFATGINSSAIVNNNVSSLNSIAIQLYDNSTITVYGNVESYYRGIDADNSTAVVNGNVSSTANSGDSARAASGSKIYIGGDSISYGDSSFGVKSIQENSFVSVSGSAITYGMYGYGSFASSGGSVVIQGNSISYNKDGNGVGATYEASVIVKGNVISESGTGIRAWHSDSNNPSLTVDGEIVAETFIEFGTTPVTYTIDDFITPTTKEGYFTYTDGFSTVWVSYPDIWGIEIESTDKYPFGGGDGTSEDTAYEISTANQLAQLAYNVNNGNEYLDKYYKLTSAIDLSGKEWVPIGKPKYNTFNGVFDGGDYSINGLTITDPLENPYYGLFGYMGNGGVIKNTKLESGIISLGDSLAHNPIVGGIAGYNNGLIKGCTNKLDIVLEYDSDTYAGGIVGMGNSNTSSYSWSGKIEDCRNEGNITIGDRGSAGGIIGAQFNSNSHTYLMNCSNTGNITGGRSVEIGGIAGRLNGTGFRDNPVINCYNTGNLTTGTLTPDASIAGDIGGIVGYLYQGTVENSFNTGDIEVLYSDTTNTSGFFIGGLVGYGGLPVIKNSYNTGMITGPEDRIGPMSGANNNYSSHVNCYYKEGTVPDGVMNTGAMKLSETQIKGLDNSVITFVNSSDEEITYGPANGALIYALNNGKSEAAYSWYYVEKYNEGYPVLYYNNEVPHVISFNSQGGTSVPAVTIKNGDSINTSPITSKDGYTFNGWYINSTGGSIVSFPYMPSGDTILYAQWTAEEEPEEPATPAPRPSVPELEIDTKSLPDGIEGEAYEFEMKADGGVAPYSWSIEGLPVGLSMSTEGIIVGISDESGNFSVKVEMMDNRNYFRSRVYDLLITEKEAESIFEDTKDHWSGDYIQEVVSRNIINGYPDGTFRPENKITREEFASILVRALGLESKTGLYFDDTLDRWSTDNISTAIYHAIIKGYSENAFGPEDLITREQMAVMIARALELDEEFEETSLSDINEASPWSESSILSAVSKGLLDGYPDGTFRPKNNLSRAEAIKVIFKLLSHLDSTN
ncbi:MAG TPA: hypothetical protein DDX29_10130 [Clostridiales bacterium]|nr:hypothetical protein [Clostridiales bacterium]